MPDFLTEQGYIMPRQLPDGRWIALMRMYASIGLFVDLDDIGYRDRYCYAIEQAADAIIDVQTWDGQGDPPGLWIKHKGRGFDDLNPRWLKDEINA